MNNDDIIDYYNDCKKDYKLVWRLNKTWGMHYGYFEKGDFRLSKAISKMNDQILKYTKITKDSVVLDAGCGYCGTAMQIAASTKCKIEAVTIVEEQVKTARQVIKSRGLDNNINVTMQDYTKTEFKDNTFDVIYGIESICYANKKEFLIEAHRLLKKNGTLIMLDGFNSKDDYTESEQKIMKEWNNGWAVNSLETGDFFINTSNDLGFTNQNYIDITKYAYKTSKKMYTYSYPAFVVDFFGRLFKTRTKFNKGNVRAARYQYIGMKHGLWQYGIFTAVKK
ncbi:MAG: class I SAM-dependent methyltransferase [Ignavibacteria bacterium]|nr:class I SAM-dependent methyltransferase [Ignavibacteria bacterium]